jgi:hypothetical protein
LIEVNYPLEALRMLAHREAVGTIRLRETRGATQ